MPTLAPPLIPRKLDSREERLDILLDHYKEARAMLRERTTDNTGRGKAESKSLEFPDTWDASYQELDRALKRMAGLACRDYSEVSPRYRERFIDLQRWYIRAEHRRVPLMRTDKKGRLYHVTTANGPQYEIECLREGRPVLVLEGLMWLSLEYVGEPALSKELEAKRAA